MAENSNVVDELVVKLTLDAEEYEKSEKNITVIINKTEKNLKDIDKKRKDRDDKQNKRWKESTKSVKDFGSALGKLALTVGSVLGVGAGVGGLIGAVTALTGFETGLRKSAVSTGLSNRELQAYGSTIRRLGGDADAGREAIASLAKEQQQFALTGSAPTLQAFQRVGVNAGPNTNIVDLIAEAQQRYRAAPEGQRRQMEATLSASGVNNEIIVAIKSEKDVREEYTRSFAESATENRKALDAVTDSLEAVKNSALDLANTIAAIVQPYVEQFSKYASEGAQKLSAFADEVAAAGGGVNGFMTVLDRENPELSKTLSSLREGLQTFAEAIDLAAYGLKLIGEGFKALYDWVDKKLSFLTGGEGKTNPLKGVVSTIGDAVKWAWGESLRDAQAEGPLHLSGDGRAKLTPGAQAALAATPGAASGASRFNMPTKASDLMANLIGRGFSVAQAAGIVANAQGESSYNPAAVNNAGGGQGAHGLFQWRGDRLKAFQARYGKLPSQATIDEQLDFLTSGAELRQLRRGLAGGSTAGDYAAGINDRFEVNGRAGEAAKRAALATQLAAQYQGATGGGGSMVALNGPVYVQANNPEQLVSGVQRVSGVTNYGSSTR
jgi:hypothetical protein